MDPWDAASSTAATQSTAIGFLSRPATIAGSRSLIRSESCFSLSFMQKVLYKFAFHLRICICQTNETHRLLEVGPVCGSWPLITFRFSQTSRTSQTGPAFPIYLAGPRVLSVLASPAHASWRSEE